MKRCLSCMAEIDDNIKNCPYCGFSEDLYDSGNYRLPLNTYLKGQYIVGKVLGEGGFGITYIAWDTNLEVPVAIKELYPKEFVSRNTTGEEKYSVSLYTNDKDTEELYDAEKKKFLEEARKLAKMSNVPGIVGVRECFEENGTAYIVMEYIDGCTLEQYCNINNPSPNEIVELLQPIYDSLIAIHKKKILHRDISPDNIKISNDRQPKLLDFGAARSFADEKTMSVILKKDYAPIEQHQTDAKQGPYTDIYALCATLYNVISKIKPPRCFDRIPEENDKIVNISNVAGGLKPSYANAIMKGLAVKPENRWQNVEDFVAALSDTSFGAADSEATEYIRGDSKPTGFVQPENANLGQQNINSTVQPVPMVPVAASITPDMNKKSSGGSKKTVIAVVAGLLIVGVAAAIIFLTAGKDDSDSKQAQESEAAVKEVSENPDNLASDSITPDKEPEKIVNEPVDAGEPAAPVTDNDITKPETESASIDVSNNEKKESENKIDDKVSDDKTNDDNKIDDKDLSGLINTLGKPDELYVYDSVPGNKMFRNWGTYSFDGEDVKGFEIQGGVAQDVDVLYGLDGKYYVFTCFIKQLDNREDYTLKVYLDGKNTETYNYKKNDTSLNQITINSKGAKQCRLSIETGGNGGAASTTYIFANACGYVDPEYSEEKILGEAVYPVELYSSDTAKNEVYYKDDKTFKMGGKKYNGCGLKCAERKTSYAIYNLGGKYETAEFDLGYIDSSIYYGGNVNGYAAVKIYNIDTDEVIDKFDQYGIAYPSHVALDVKGVNKVRIEMVISKFNPGSVPEYGIGNMVCR